MAMLSKYLLFLTVAASALMCIAFFRLLAPQDQLIPERRELPANLELLPTAYQLQQCRAPQGGFKAWRQGVVSELDPIIKRNCTKLFQGDQQEIETVKAQTEVWNNSLSDEELFRLTGDCLWVKNYFYNNLYLTKQERSFPLAYSFVVYNNPQQVLRLLRYLYRPVNAYCIHPDNKSSPLFMSIFNNITKCLDNVMVASELYDVGWGAPTLMQAQMSCLSDLVRYRDTQRKSKQWKYLINLCGKELPMMSSHDTVAHLKRLNGSSAIKARIIHPNETRTVSRLHNRTVPFNLQLYKGLAYMAISYDFAHFLITNSTAIAVYEFFKTCYIPEEHFYATLYMIPGVPGGHNPTLPQWYYFYTLRVFWLNDPTHNDMYCTGPRVHSICIVTVGELQKMASFIDKPHALFHNKYFMELDHVVMDCIEERFVAKNKQQYELECFERS